MNIFSLPFVYRIFDIKEKDSVWFNIHNWFNISWFILRIVSTNWQIKTAVTHKLGFVAS